jgi:hypothetical protein
VHLGLTHNLRQSWPSRKESICRQKKAGITPAFK